MVLTSLTASFADLAPWPAAGDLPAQEWGRYVDVARHVQRADPVEVERAIAEFLSDRRGADSAQDETRIFLLMRVVFDLPEHAPVAQRRPYKGWVNWPPPDADGIVSLAWPVSWQDGRPALVAPYEGSEGRPYAAVEEHRHLRAHYPLRTLPGKTTDQPEPR